MLSCDWSTYLEKIKEEMDKIVMSGFDKLIFNAEVKICWNVSRKNSFLSVVVQKQENNYLVDVLCTKFLQNGPF